MFPSSVLGLFSLTAESWALIFYSKSASCLGAAKSWCVEPAFSVNFFSKSLVCHRHFSMADDKNIM
jgi:hypothetical protein